MSRVGDVDPRAAYLAGLDNGRANMSFSTRSEPIVCTPEEALACFVTTTLDALAIGPYLLTKR
jgi:hypothetical protein